MKTFLLCFLVAAFSTQTPLFGQGVSKTGTVAATFLEIPVGASAVGMGSAFVSLANDATALYWNPAGSAWLAQSEVLAMHTNWIADTRFDYASLVLPLEDFGTLGVNFTSLNMDDMKVTTVEKPEGTGEYFSAGDFAVGVSYAHRLTDRFTIGFNVKYIQQTIWHDIPDRPDRRTHDRCHAYQFRHADEDDGAGCEAVRDARPHKAGDEQPDPAGHRDGFVGSAAPLPDRRVDDAVQD